MSDAPELPSPEPPDVEAAIARARTDLQSVRGALDRITGGASPRVVLAELAQQLASDLAGFFDNLPMENFVGRVARDRRPWRWIVPARRMTHRIVLARFLSASPPWQTGVGYTASSARIAVLAIGADGVLRSGIASEQIHLPEGVELTLDPLFWDDGRIRRVPSRPIALTRWTGEREPHDVASPGFVLEALTAIAALIARESHRDLALLQRFL